EDFDGDGDFDACLILEGGAQLVWAENLGGEFGPLQLINDGLSTTSWGATGVLTLTDMEGDGDIDLFYKGPSISNDTLVYVYVFENNIFSESILNDEPIKDSVHEFGDIDGDGDVDFVIYDLAQDQVLWYPLDLDSLAFKAPILITEVEDDFWIDQIIVQDLNGDTINDIVLSYEWGDKDLIININSLFLSSVLMNDERIEPGLGFSKVTFLDLTDDGNLDMITTRGGLRFYIGETPYSSIFYGKTYWDENENQTLDPDEIGLLNQKVTIEPEGYSFWSNQQGEYIFAYPPGNYNLVLDPTGPWEPSTDINIPLLPNSVPQEFNFGLKATTDLFAGETDLSSGPTRCGFEVPFWLTYKNTGTLATDVVLTLEIDSLTTFLSATPAPSSVSNTVITWEINDFPPTYQGNIDLMLQMPSVDFLGEEVSFLSYLDFYEPGGSEVVYSSIDQAEIYTSIIDCAYDPNDKLVSSSFINYDNYTLFGDVLEYTVRFQNTGTDTAFTVRIEDLLAPELDWSTFMPYSASHTMHTELRDNGTVVFLFPDILLPDSTTNEPASHGYVKFQIKALDGLPEETTIENWAGIYFDFNPPIITNTVTNIMVSELPVVAELTPPRCPEEFTGSINIPVHSSLLSYQWSTGDEGPFLGNLGNGTYDLTVVNADGVVLVDTAFALLNDDMIFFSTNTIPPSIGQANGSIEITDIGGAASPYTVIWDTDPAQTGLIATGLATGTYSATISDADGCTWNPEFILEESTGLQAVNLGNPMKIYPNPAKDILYIDWIEPLNPTGVVELLQVDGGLLQSKPLGTNTVISIEDVASGVYQIRITTKQGVWIERVVIE
ncbi:MAG: T9SS type A sorting domain-containing protein, partial [Bacteroidota bacterium]